MALGKLRSLVIVHLLLPTRLQTTADSPGQGATKILLTFFSSPPKDPRRLDHGYVRVFKNFRVVSRDFFPHMVSLLTLRITDGSSMDHRWITDASLPNFLSG